MNDAHSIVVKRDERAAATLVPDELDARVAEYAEGAHAARTRKAYQGDWLAFERWCHARGEGALPASPRTLARYLAHLAELGRKASTIRRARIAIGLAHGHAGLERPDRDQLVRTLERGIGRKHGTREEGATPLLDVDIARLVAGLGNGPREERDRALILLGYAGALRSSELAGLNVEDITFTAKGVEVFLARSKEDQLGRGHVTTIERGAKETTCPVRALERWMGRVGRPSGPLFRVVRGSIVEHARIHPRGVARAVQRAAERAGLEGDYSAHSLRSGLATSAWARGVDVRAIQEHGRWGDVRSLQRYIRPGRVEGRPYVAAGLL